MIAAAVFWTCLGLLAYTYLGYPALLAWWYRRRGLPPEVPPSAEGRTPPRVAILMAAYNEEAVLPAKLASIRALDWPADRLVTWVGSDGSTDATDALLAAAAAEGMNLRPVRLEGRNGKASVLNELRRRALAEGADLFLLTDANILYRPDLLRRLTPHFARPDVGLVGAVVTHDEALSTAGIARQEGAYMARENRLKLHEGALWGTMMGAFGACYMVRAEDFPELPPHFLMEDFYASMHVLASGRSAMLEPEAVCYEDLPDALAQEFRRKVRISAGNFQNLGRWAGTLWPPSALAFCFFSHKILRWLGPVWLLSLFATSAWLAWEGSFLYRTMWWAQAFFWTTPLWDALFRRAGLHIGPLRLIGYFCSMNVALLAGFFRYLGGIRQTAWQPTTRQPHHG